EFLSDRENGQARLSTVGASGELLMAVLSKDRVEGIKAKVANAREDWRSLMNNLQMREDALKDKASRIERIVGEHQLFSQGLKELQDWALLAALQEREIQLKMLLTRGEAVQRNTSAEGVPVIRKQIQDLKDSWDSLLSASIQCKSLQESCSKGHTLLASVLSSRERVIPWGAPQIEDRALDTAKREWASYQSRLEETQAQLHSMLTRLRQMGHRFLNLAQWLEDTEKMASIRSNRRSDRNTKQSQLKKLQVREMISAQDF
ncbi:hypothetical protein XENOCAPTIV_027649, partial [Xenoophorus captivus]